MPIHPFVTGTYKARWVYTYLTIIPVYTLFYQLNLRLGFWIAYGLQALLWPHLAYFFAINSSDSKRTEIVYNHHIGPLLFGFWLPPIFFNPYITLLLFTVIGSGSFIGGGFPLFFSSILSAMAGILISCLIFGFHFSTTTSITTVITAGSSILFAACTIAYLNFRSIREIALTRKQLMVEKSKVEKAFNARNKAYHRLSEELERAANYVSSMLPNPIQEGSVRTEWKFIPSVSLGGDAFGYNWLDEDHFSVYILDVSGHGVGAALLSVSVLNVIRSQSLANTDFKNPGQVLHSLNTAFQSEDNDDMFFTIWYGVYNKVTRELTFCSGGHPPALLLSEQGGKEPRLTPLRTPNYVVGGMPESTYEKGQCTVDSNSTLFIFSDGVYEIEKTDGSMWSFKEFSELLKEKNGDSRSKLDQLFHYVKNLGNSEHLEDDYTIIAISFI